MKKILFIFLPSVGIALLLGTYFIITSLSSPTTVEDCGSECQTQNQFTTLEKNLAATLQIVLDNTVPVINYNEKLYDDTPNSQTLVQQVLFGVDDSGYLLEYGVASTKDGDSQESTPRIYPEYLSLTVKYKVVDTDVSMSFLDRGVDGTVDEVYINDVQVTAEDILADAQARYETELGITAAYYFGVQKKNL